MRHFLILFLVVGTVWADVGYNYEPPKGGPQKPKAEDSFTQQSGTVGISSLPAFEASDFRGSGQKQQGFGGQDGFRGSQGSFGVSQGGSSSFGGSQGSSGSFGGSQGSSGSFGGSSGSFGGSSGSFGGSSGSFGGSSGSFGGSSGSFGGSSDSFGGSSGSFSSSFGQAQKEPVVKKFYYVYAAPEEQRSVVRKQQTVSAPEKHYKVIFVKVPSYGGSNSVSYRLGPQVEEKTTVYVLVKDQEEEPQQEPLPDIPVAPPTKPEVVFIKYKSNKKVDNVDGISGVSVINGGSISEDEINAELVKAGGLSNVASSDFSGDQRLGSFGGSFQESSGGHSSQGASHSGSHGGSQGSFGGSFSGAQGGSQGGFDSSQGASFGGSQGASFGGAQGGSFGGSFGGQSAGFAGLSGQGSSASFTQEEVPVVKVATTYGQPPHTY